MYICKATVPGTSMRLCTQASMALYAIISEYTIGHVDIERDGSGVFSMQAVGVVAEQFVCWTPGRRKSNCGRSRAIRPPAISNNAIENV